MTALLSLIQNMIITTIMGFWALDRYHTVDLSPLTADHAQKNTDETLSLGMTWMNSTVLVSWSWLLSKYEMGWLKGVINQRIWWLGVLLGRTKCFFSKFEPINCPVQRLCYQIIQILNSTINIHVFQFSTYKILNDCFDHQLFITNVKKCSLKLEPNMMTRYTTASHANQPKA